ncbi:MULTISPECIES: AAA family ATPase [unclassified Lysobacter]
MSVTGDTPLRSNPDGRAVPPVESPGTESLDSLIGRMKGQRMALARCLRILIALARSLAQLHGQGILHKDIKPANVLVDDAGDVRLTGFAPASRLRRERQVLAPPETIAGTFAYMAPEQTGRMNRWMDARSDLYSFGITMYELLTGTLPFSASNPMEWIHCHIARQPTPPGERVQGVPPILDEIVLKLLAKDPEARYQTAAGLANDLRRCLRQWEAEGRIGRFELAERDVPDQLVIPEKLYGRHAQIAELLGAFDRVVNQGTTELVLVSGYAGIGKSSIVRELHKVLAPAHALFATGKLDQFKRDIPYATLAQAFRSLVRDLLNKSDTELAHWRDALIDALGPNGQLMVNLIPELALIIGEQPPTPPVESQDAAMRFQLAFVNLVEVFARHAHPLVLFIDDLQWLDPGTLSLLQRLATPPGCGHLMLIGAYRDNEVGPMHPLSTTIDVIRSGGGIVTQIELAPLERHDIAQLTADALHADLERTRPLAELVSEKTGGNPFFAIQFVTALADEALLGFDPESGSWRWDIERIRARGVTDNLAQLMTAKLGRLSAPARESLGQLACLGNVAEIGMLAALRGVPVDEVNATLRGAVEEGLVVVTNGSLSFIHDRVHEAAYALVPVDARALTHLRIGRMLLSLAPDMENESNIFETANQFERGASAIDSLAERESVAGCFLAAGGHAKAASAYASAKNYFAAGRALLGSDSWERRYELTFKLELGRAECEIVDYDLAEAEERLTALSQHATGLTDQAEVVCLAVLLYFTTGRNERAVEAALCFLAGAGIDWSPRPSEEDVQREYLEMRRRLAGRPMQTLTDLPAMSDKRSIAILAVLTELFPAAYAVDRHLLDLVLLRMTNLSLDHGHGESSSVAYAALNMTLGPHFADYTTAYDFGRLACELVDRRGIDRFKARVYSCFAAFTMPWFKHLPLCQPMMVQAFQIGSSRGDMAFAAYNLRNLLTHLLMSGVPLAQVQQEAEQAMTFARKIELGLPAERFIGQLALVQALRGLPTGQDPADEAWAMGEFEDHPQMAMMVCYHWVFRLHERFIAGDFPGALVAAARIEGIRWAMRSSIEEAAYEFHAALSHAAACETATPTQRDHHVRELSKHHGRIAAWAVTCPENFAGQEALVGAEIARLEGREVQAQQLYEAAVARSRTYGFLHNEAIANELAGQHYAALGLETIACAYLRNARDCYERWGAEPKVRQLDTRYPRLCRRPPHEPVNATIDAPVVQLDVEAVDKASQTLSSEMILPALLEKLMRIAVEHAGAERGLLILLHDGVPVVEAEAATGRGSVDVTLRRSRVVPSDLPQSALQYVLRTRERLVLDDASAGGLDRDDEYIGRHRPRSLLCLPIFKQARVIGVLYLENNIATRAFTAGKVAVLDFLASQAAIWLENARLYSDLRRSEVWLKEAQHLSSTGSFYWLVDLETLEFSEQLFRTYQLDPAQPVTLDLVATRVHPDDLSLFREIIEVARTTGADLDHTYRAQMPDRSIKHLHLVAHAVRNSDGRSEYIGAVQDVTQGRLSEEALGKVRSELAHVARITTLGVLTASIAHEVNQPLAGIVTNASTCLRMLDAHPPNVDGARSTAQRMIRDGNRAADVITRLRALFTNKGVVVEPVDLNEATGEIIALSKSELRKAGVQLVPELACDLPSVTGDRVQLQQVILNLLLNATDAMRDIDDRPRRMEIRTERDGDDRVRFSVRDVGEGIDPQSSSRLFEAFYSTKEDGMGIGLSISKFIIESHHGRLLAATNDGPGATFSFSLPRAVE